MVTSVYAAILALLFILLSVRTIRLRRHLRIAIGDAGNPDMQRAMRVHANFAEYVPFTVLLILLLELQGLIWAAHLFGLCLLAGRLIHAAGVSRQQEDIRFRFTGMALTFLALAGAALTLLVIGPPAIS